MWYICYMRSHAKDPDFRVPRGLEAYVPDLATLRAAIWPKLSDDLHLILEVADYVGLERAFALGSQDLDDLYGVLPGDLWGRAAARIDPTAVHLLKPAGARAWSRDKIIAELALAFSKSN